MVRKLSLSQIEEIKEIHKTKKIIIKELAEQFNVCTDTIRYHLFENYRIKRAKYYRERYQNLSKEVKKLQYEKKKPYYKEYMKNRYKTNELFREKQKERARNYKRKNK